MVNPQAPRTLADDDFAALVGDVHVSELVSDPQLRRLAGDTAMVAMERYKSGAAGRLSSATRHRLGFDSRTMRNFTREGVSALTDGQKAQLRAALTDERMGQLKALGGRQGVVTAERRDNLFCWIDRFDNNGQSDHVTLATPSGILTPAGIVTKRLLENSSTPHAITETDFVKGFRNGFFDPNKFDNTPENAGRREALRKAGLLERFDEAARANGGEIHLNVPQLRALYRAVDAVDHDGSGNSFITRNGGNITNGTLPFNVNNPNEKPTASGIMVAALRDIFHSNYRSDAPDDAINPYDAPPPSATDDTDPLRGDRRRLSDRKSIDRDSFADYMRDVRIDIADLLKPENQLTDAQKRDVKALATAGFPVDKLRTIASSNGVIGGPNAEMARLYAMLRAAQGGRRDAPLLLNSSDGSSITAPAAGRVISVLERYMTRYDLVTGDTLKSQLDDGMHFRSGYLDHRLPGVSTNASRTVRDELRRLGFDVNDFEATMVKRHRTEDRSKWDASAAAAELYARLKKLSDDQDAQPGTKDLRGYQDARPGTIALASVSVSTGVRSLTKAGKVWDLMRDSGYLAVTEQQRRTYLNANNAMAAPFGTTSVSLPFDFHRMRTSTDCLVAVSKMIASRGGRRIIRNTVGSWLAKSDDSQGRMSADVSDLTAGRKFIDYALDHRWKIGVGVVRLNGRNLNIDNMTDHYVLIYGRGIDGEGRLYYEYADSADGADSANKSQHPRRFYVDPSTNLLYAPVNSPYTVGHGGYQVSHIRAYADGDFRQEFFNATGTYPRDATPYRRTSATGRRARRPHKKP